MALADALQYLDERADRRSEAAWAIRSPWLSVFITAAYLLIVLWLGPLLMRARRPFNLTRTLVVYNAFQVAANIYFDVKLVSVYLRPDYDFWCQPMFYNETKNPLALELWTMTYYFYWLKIVDLMDTVFFVLRKKNNQVTFLHVYHHSSLVILLWIAARFYPGGTLLVAATINAFVHSIMYSYYLLAALHVPFVFIIKQYITTIQLVQFVLNIAILARDLLLTSCGSPTWFVTFILLQNAFFFCLFMRFYRESYRRAGHRRLAHKQH